MADDKMPLLEAKPAPSSRITVHSMVHHELKDDQPTTTEMRFWMPLETDEEPYQRRKKVGEQWEALDLGWISDPSFICVENLEGRPEAVQPSPEEMAAIAARVLELSFDGKESWLINPRQHFLGLPSSAKSILIRCQSGVAAYRVTIFPR